VRPQRGTVAVALAIGLGLLAACSQVDAPHLGADADTPGKAADGAALFDGRCGRCHGAGAAGTDHGPSLLDPFYAASHQPDEVIEHAIRDGVNGYHTHLGDMPRIGGLTDAEVKAIIAYVRERQQAAGLN